MPSLIDASKPVEVNPTTQSVRDNFAAAKSEIETLQNFQSNVSDVDFFAYLTPAQKVDWKAGTLSFDASVPLQAAINAANALATAGFTGTRTKLVVQAGSGLLSSLVTVKEMVDLDCRAQLVNNMASAVNPCLKFKAGSSCTRLTLNHNAKGGIEIGDAATSNEIDIGLIRTYALGKGAGCFGIRFLGSAIRFNKIEVIGTGAFGAEICVDIGDGGGSFCSLIEGNYFRTRGALAGRIIKAQGIYINQWIQDSCSVRGIDIDNGVSDVKMNIRAFWDDSVAGAPGWSSRGILNVGELAAAPYPSGLDIKIWASNTGGGGIALQLRECANSKFYIDSNNASLLSGNASPSGTGVQYVGTGSSFPTNVVVAKCQSLAFPHIGTPFGTLIELDDTITGSLTEIHSLPIRAPHLEVTDEFFGAVVRKYFGEINTKKTTNISIATNIVLADVADMDADVFGGEKWVVEWCLGLGGPLSTTGFKVAVVTPAGSVQGITAEFVPDVPNAANRQFKYTFASGTALDFTAAQCAGCSDGFLRVRAYVEAAIGGEIKLQLSQSTSSATALVGNALAVVMGAKRIA